ncbi:MAG: transcription initiation factor IIB family protein [Desulfurococcales archaeon]|nr:transcription initiation factor IIB family protein [Desulfurococcales archaeon]
MGAGEGEGGEVKCKNIVLDEHGKYVCLDTGHVIEELAFDETGVKAYSPEDRERKVHHSGAVRPSDVNWGVGADLTVERHPLKGLTQTGLPGKIPPRPTKPFGAADKNLQQAINLIKDVASKLELTDTIVEEASRIYREALQKGLTRGRSIESIAAAALYAACRIHGTPHTITQIIEAMKGTVDPDVKREVSRSYRLIVRDLGLKIPVRRPEDFVYTITSALGLPERVADEAINIIREAKKRGLTSGKDPSGMAGAAVYLAALKHGIRKTQKEIASVAGVTEVTIRNRYKEILKTMNIEQEEIDRLGAI